MRREPAFYVGLIQAVLVLLLSFGIPGLNDVTVPLIMAVVSAVLGVYTAYVTRDTMLAAGVALLNAAVALAAGYGFALDPAQTAAIIALASILLGAWQRGQTTPLAQGTFREATAA
jgi:hypothetical protein